jgi:hypothetical protein
MSCTAEKYLDVRSRKLNGVRLEVGAIFYMLQITDNDVPLITTYKYVGTVDDNPKIHFFEAQGLSDANIFLEESDVYEMLNLQSLRAALEELGRAEEN